MVYTIDDLTYRSLVYTQIIMFFVQKMEIVCVLVVALSAVFFF